MSNRIDKILHDVRGNLRVKENKPVGWHIKEGTSQGLGTVRNISLSGMLLETNEELLPGENNIFGFESTGGQNGFIPQSGRMVWQKEKGLMRKRYQYGIEFIDPDSKTVDHLRQKVQDGIAHFISRRKWKMLANVLLIAAIIGLGGYSLWMSGLIYQDIQVSNTNMMNNSENQAKLTRSYKDLNQTTVVQLKEVTTELGQVTEKLSETQLELANTQKLYQEGQEMLINVSQDLTEAKNALVQTEQMLVDAKYSNANLNKEMAALRDLNAKKIAELKSEMNHTIALLEDKNIKLSKEMSSLQSQIDYYGGDVRNMGESKALLRLYKSRMKLVKAKIKHFNKEAKEVKKTAMGERDRIRVLLGNNGYLVKNGQSVKVDEEKYQLATLGFSDDLEKVSESSSQLKIDVMFVE